MSELRHSESAGGTRKILSPRNYAPAQTFSAGAKMIAAIFLVFTSSLVVPLVSQRVSPPPHPLQSVSSSQDQDSPLPQNDQEMAWYQHRIKALNEARQKSMVSDTEKLLKLTQELNDEVNAPNSNLSAAEINRKTVEIEKLAHHIRDRMTFAVGAPAETSNVFTVVPH